jgi:hypothetical protein
MKINMNSAIPPLQYQLHTHYSTAKENKYTTIGTKTRVDVTPQNKKIANRPTARN